MNICIYIFLCRSVAGLRWWHIPTRSLWHWRMPKVAERGFWRRDKATEKLSGESTPSIFLRLETCWFVRRGGAIQQPAALHFRRRLVGDGEPLLPPRFSERVQHLMLEKCVYNLLAFTDESLFHVFISSSPSYGPSSGLCPGLNSPLTCTSHRDNVERIFKHEDGSINSSSRVWHRSRII